MVSLARDDATEPLSGGRYGLLFFAGFTGALIFGQSENISSTEVVSTVHS